MYKKDNEPNRERISRRSFLRIAGLASAGIAATGLAGCTSNSSISTEVAVDSVGNGLTDYLASSYEPAETYDADLVVIGSGMGGVSAAVEGAEMGMNVYLIDAADVLGGVSAFTEGTFGLGSKMQLAADIELPSVNDVVEEEMIYTNYRSNSLFWSDFITQSGENIDWMMNHGVEFDRVDSYNGASSFICFHWGLEGANTSVREHMTAAAEETCTCMTNTRAMAIDTENGAVKSVIALKEDGTIIEINSPNAVVATGGIVSNPDLLGKLTGRDLSLSAAVFPSASQGDGFEMAQAVDADETSVSLMAQMKVYGWGAIQPVSIAGCFQPHLIINSKGERFMTEDLQVRYYSALYVNSRLAQGDTYMLLDANFVSRLENEGCIIGNVSVKNGDLLPGLTDDLEKSLTMDGDICYKGETLAELAEAIGADPDILQATVERYNSLVDAGVDEDYGKNPQYLIHVGNGPYYAVRPDLSLVTSIGGIKINRDCNVLDRDGNKITGLFSAGVEACPLYQETYNFQLSGGMSAWCVYSGRVAADNALENIKA